jgi:MFS family permease
MIRMIKNYFSGEAAAVLQLPNFRKFLAFRFFMTMATMMQSITVGWHLYHMTGSVLALGMIGLVEVIPQISVSLFAGHYIDIMDRQKIIKYTSLLLLVGSGILVLYSLPYYNAYAYFGTIPIYVTFFLTGLVRGILMPAHTAFMGQLVPRPLLTNAATWNSINWHISAVAGPALGGLFYGFFGITFAYIMVFVFYLASFYLIGTVEPQGPVIAGGKRGNMKENISEGVRFVFNNQILLGAFTLDMFAVLFGGAVAILPAFASDVLHTGPQGLGFLRACPAIGSIIMSFFLASFPPLNHTGRYLLAGVAGFGICIIGFALSKVILAAAIFLIISGACDNISVVVRGTILQLFTPEEMKGRVASVNSIFIGSSNELGAFESGVAASAMGLIPSVIFGGTMTLIVVSIVGWKFVPLRNLSLKLKTEV